jgi:hypothetical protein
LYEVFAPILPQAYCTSQNTHPNSSHLLGEKSSQRHIGMYIDATTTVDSYLSFNSKIKAIWCVRKGDECIECELEYAELESWAGFEYEAVLCCCGDAGGEVMVSAEACVL